MSSIDLTEIPLVSEFELARPMKHLIDSERALCLMRGASLEDRRVVEGAFWDSYTGSTQRGVAILLRFWCLVETFGAKRFKALLLHKGYQVIGPAVAAAAQLRLNANWGFNPQKLLTAMQPELEKTEQRVPQKTPSVVPAYVEHSYVSSHAA